MLDEHKDRYDDVRGLDKKAGSKVKLGQGEMVPIITIDGPAASGKSSVSRELARRFAWNWVSTGAFYRGLAYVAAEKGVDLKDEKALTQLAHDKSWVVVLTSEKTCVILDGCDVTDEVNREAVGSLASQISQFPNVRKALLNAQRQCAVGVKGLVAEGRDCGTVIFPQAPVKVFLTARAEDRAARRAKDEGQSVAQTQDQQQLRDALDANRKAAPMQASEDSLLIDTSELNFYEVVERVENLAMSRLGMTRILGPQ